MSTEMLTGFTNYVTPVTKAVSAVAPLVNLYGAFAGSNKPQTQTVYNTQSPIYPNAEALTSNRNMGVASAGLARSAALDDLSRQLSVRGIGPNSPYSGGKATGIERAYLNALSGLDNTYLNKLYTPIGWNSSSTQTSSNNRNNLAYALAMMQFGK